MAFNEIYLMFQFCLPSYTQTLFIKIHDHSLLVANFKSFNYSVFLPYRKDIHVTKQANSL